MFTIWWRHHVLLQENPVAKPETPLYTTQGTSQGSEQFRNGSIYISYIKHVKGGYYQQLLSITCDIYLLNKEIGTSFNRIYGIVLFHNYFSPTGEQREQRILAYKQKLQNNQLSVV